MGEQGKHKVLVVDDHPIVREGLSGLINQQPDLEVCAQAANSEQALAALGKTDPDAALVDIALGKESGLELIARLKQQSPRIKILALSMHDELLFAEGALQQGASGYVMKHQATDQLLTALRQILSGRFFVSDPLAERLLRKLHTRTEQRTGVESLSTRELEVFRLLGTGLSTSEVSERLHISPKTVETHRARIKDKLELTTAAQLVVLAAKWLAKQGTRSELPPAEPHARSDRHK